MARTVDDVRAGRLMMKWEIPGLEAREGGFLLGDQIFCVQEGFASTGFIAAAARLFCTCFHDKSSAEAERDFEVGGLSWDFIIAIFRGGDVNDVVAACALVYGQSCGGRQFFYVFNVCTDPCVRKCGLAGVLMGAVDQLCCAVERSRACDYWKNFLCFSDKLWLVLAVDLTETLVVPPRELVAFYTKCGFSASNESSIPIHPLECTCWRSVWAITSDDSRRCQMWREVLPQERQRIVLSERARAVLCPLASGSRVLARFEQLLDRYFFYSL